MTEEYELDGGGPPAQTGSVVHAGVAEFHRLQSQPLGIRKKGAWDAINAALPTFPLADTTEVRLYITPYMDDPRNIKAECFAIEQQVEFSLDPHPLDQTGERIYVQGTLDQIRYRPGSHNFVEVWDLKTGKKTGFELIHDHAIQVASYTIGAMQKYPHMSFDVGGIIRAYGYRVRGVDTLEPDGVFWSMGYSTDTLKLILEPVQLSVAMIRNGHATFGSGPHCTYCEYGGLIGCLHKYKELTREGSNG